MERSIAHLLNKNSFPTLWIVFSDAKSSRSSPPTNVCSQSVPAFEQRNLEKDQKGMQLWKWIGKTDAMKSKFVLSGPFLLIDSTALEQ
ncbi:hypothetical protein [Paraburkholderia elongata]|uniref:Uncharacterized protein n=1 Tax=Paraburkholderia elongata TaxID=2675747 RepID=A0A972SKB6_9BURK|nr:hypothetical protein [Paraburkholderia elongata]NPT57967.1 hypothetical protein [Paraburkholderia elongata]NPT57989.1 hypothetical protein [Paraburkholderia elongata]